MRRMARRPFAAALLALIVACGPAADVAEDTATDVAAAAGGEGGVMAPMFEVDPLWPKPLPNHWIMGSTIGVSVDSRDHVWVIHRQTTFNERTEIGATADPPIAVCCIPAPNILEFDREGNLVNHWGGPGEGYEWPSSNHGITIDHMDNVWIGGNGGTDAHVLKFARDGTFLMQLGRSGGNNGSNDMENYGRVAKISIDAEANEAYIADGYGNKRVVVVDADSGEFKRYWGAYGNEPDDEVASNQGSYVPGDPPARQFRGPVHCADMSNDRLLYVCDRAADRIQVFQPDGTFVNEVIIAPETLSQGSTWDIAFSPDDEQRFLYLADGQNMRVYVIDRASMEILYSFGDGGRQPGQFFAVHSIDTDSQGNIYTTETYEGKRVQKFIFMGMGSIPPGSDYVSAWPADKR